MRVGDRIEVVARWSQLLGHRGRVVATNPCVMVILEGDRRALHIGAESLRPLGSERHIGGAE